jgi:O-antigen ligase
VALLDAVTGRRDWPAWRGHAASTIAAPAAAIVVFGVLVGGGLHNAERAIAAVAGVVVLLLAARYPAATLGTLVVFVPLQTTLLSLAYRHGAPGGLVRDFSYVKDIGTAGIVVAAVVHSREMGRAARQRLDSLDWFALAYVGIATVYFIIPEFFSGSLGGQSLTVRESAWRLDCLFVILLIAARRCEFSPAALRRLRNLVFLIGGAMLWFAVYEAVSKTAYNNFLVHTLGLPQYQSNILHVTPPVGDNYVTQGVNGGVSTLRAGSLLADPLKLGFYMVLPLAFGLERLTTTGFRPLAVLGAVAGGVTIVLTETRAALVSAGIAILLLLWLNQRRRAPARLRVVVLLVAGAVLLAPVLGHTTAVKRFSNVFNTNNSDSVGHVSATIGGTTKVAEHPTGLGLGANPATGNRFGTSNSSDTENSYLQVGTELGVAGMVFFIGMYISMLRLLWQRSRQRTPLGNLAAGAWLAAWALFIGGLFLQAWDSFEGPLTFAALTGAALYKYESADRSVTSPALGR